MVPLLCLFAPIKAPCGRVAAGRFLRQLSTLYRPATSSSATENTTDWASD